MTVNPEQFYGKGFDHLFPEGSSPVTTTPWPRAGRNKHLRDYDEQAVGDAVRSSPPSIEDVDTRTLHSTQPGVTAPGVRYYSSGEYDRSGKTYADGESVGNRFPVVYNRSENDGRVTPMLLSGHHRAAAALVEGKPLQAIVVEGGYGRPRKEPT